MITIRPIRPGEYERAKDLILLIAREIFEWKESIVEISCMYAQNGVLSDLDDIDSTYNKKRGLFLAVFDDQEMIGTGAIREWNLKTCELKRLWLLDAYRGKRIGYETTMLLFEHARAAGFQRVRLITSPKQVRAISFYESLGFELISITGENEDDYLYEMDL